MQHYSNLRLEFLWERFKWLENIWEIGPAILEVTFLNSFRPYHFVVCFICCKELSWNCNFQFLVTPRWYSSLADFLKFIYSEKATKFCEISTLFLFYVVPLKSKVETSQNFVAFSEYINFEIKLFGYSWSSSCCQIQNNKQIIDFCKIYRGKTCLEFT